MLSLIAWSGRRIVKRACWAFSLVLILALLAGCQTTFVTNTVTTTLPGPTSTATLPVTVTTTATATATVITTQTPPTVTVLATVPVTVPTTFTVTQTTTLTPSASASALGGQLATIALTEKDLPAGWVEVSRNSGTAPQGVLGELVVNFMSQTPKAHEAGSMECDLVLFKTVALAQQAATPLYTSFPGVTVTQPAIGDEAYTYAFSNATGTATSSPYASLVAVIARKGAYIVALSCYGQADGMDQAFIEQVQGWAGVMVGRMG